MLGRSELPPAGHRQPATWQNPDTTFYADSTYYADSTAVAAEIEWWRLFGDTVLTNLISIGVEENLDVRVAAARVEELMGATE